MAATFVVAVYLAFGDRPSSVFDETAHFDYVYHLLHGGLPKTASPLRSESVWEMTCRGGLEWYSQPICAHLPASSLPAGGVNYVLTYFPLYYGIVAPFAALLHACGMDLWNACRVCSAALYAGGIGLLTWSLIRLRLSRLAAVGIGLAVMSVPALQYMGATITPDSMAILAGAAPLFLVTLRVSWERRLMLGSAVAVVAALIKPNFLPLAGMTVLLMIVAPLAGDEEPRPRFWGFERRQLLRAVVALVVPALAAGAWQVFRSHDLAPGQTSTDGGLTARMLHTDASLWSVILRDAGSILQPLDFTPYPTPQGMSLALSVIEAVLLGGTIVIALSRRYGGAGWDWTFALAGITGLVASAVYLPATFYLAYHSIGTQPRYAFPLVPLCVAAVALFISGRFTRWLLLAGGSAFAIYAFVVLHRFYH
jgi:hypothetical protein